MSHMVEAVLVLACLWLAWTILPPGHAIRVRNAFLLRRGREEDFVWTPVAPPADYRVETRRPPAEIERALADAGVFAIANDWDRARAIVTMLVSHSQREGAIRADLATTFRGIVDGRGYCADYVRVYLAAASGAGLFCRQWAFSFDGFGGHGHTFLEVFDRQRDAWSFLDVHNNVYAVLSGSPRPLSALELRRAIIETSGRLQFPRAGPGRLGFRHRHKLLDYYRRGVSEWYLYWGNAVITRDALSVPHLVKRWIGPLMHRTRSATWRLPAIVALTTCANEARITRMERLRLQVIGIVITISVLVTLLLVLNVFKLFQLPGHG